MCCLKSRITVEFNLIENNNQKKNRQNTVFDKHTGVS